MKKVMLSIFVMLLSILLGYTQELPKIIPPSPNASAIHVYGNTQVNYYTGAPNIEIPIYTIKEGGLTLPIYLKYTGGNGIKVEEVASWVGLGWTLNTGGAISRTIRGIADEDQTRQGLFNTNGVPILDGTNFQEFDQIGDGYRDGEPDMFMYNYPEGSGSFMFDYNENIYFKPKKNIKILHNVGVESESISAPHCETYDECITDFTLINEYGNEYLFKDKERSNTVTFGVNFSDNRGFPSSWYLSRIQNAQKTRSINFEYDSYSYSIKRRQGSIVKSMESDVYTETQYIGKRLKKINFSEGTVEFIASSSIRKDINNQKYLEKIIVRDKNNKIIKILKFNYKYLTASNLVDVDANISISTRNRLLLKSIEECNNGDCMPPYVFDYDFSKYLPNRFSKAIDHWGYYNGQTSNTKYEPKHWVTWHNAWLTTTNKWITEQVGYANREPNHIYAVAGVLNKIVYPTGGSTTYEYEGNMAIHNKLQRKLIGNGVGLMRENEEKNIDVKLFSEATPKTVLTVQGHYPDINCRPIIKLKNINSNVIYNLSIDGVNYPKEIEVSPGSYKAWFELTSLNGSSCIQDNPALISLSWQNESESPAAPVGGLRIKTITDFSLNNVDGFKRSFYYNYDDGLSSGRIVSYPEYYGLVYHRTSDVSTYIPIGYKRYVSSNTPLSTTQGSEVGYGKVTVTSNDGENGKSEYYYTNSEDYPDVYNSIYVNTEKPHYQVYEGVKIYPFPLPEVDSKDYLRGKLKKEVVFKSLNGSFYKTYEKNVFYDSLKYSVGDMASFDDYIKNAAKMIRGLKVQNYSAGADFTYYDIHTGYMLPSKQIVETYYDNKISKESSSTSYKKDLNGIISFYIPIEKTITNSQGEVLKTETKYAHDVNDTRLISEHRIAEPLEILTHKDNTLLSHQKTVYNDQHNSSNLYLPEIVQTAKGSQGLEDRVIYHSYDSKSNPVEVSKKDGTKIYYVWGYEQTQPIAKIEGYTTITATQQGYINNAITASNNDTSDSLENTLRDKLQLVRSAFPDSQITTFTYDPLIGVTSITDPRGETVYYEYDNFNRLEFVKDAQSNILSENQYNYKN